MKEYIRHFIAIFATFFGSQATLNTTSVAQDPEAQEWAAAKSAGTVKALEEYLAQYPVGRFSREAFREIIRLSDSDVNESLICDTIDNLDPQLEGDDCPPLAALY